MKIWNVPSINLSQNTWSPGPIHLKVVAWASERVPPAEKEAASDLILRVSPQIRNPPPAKSPSDKDPSDIPE